MNIYYEIERLINYALQQELITHQDVIYVRNQLYFKLELEPEVQENNKQYNLSEYLVCPDQFLDNICTYLSDKPDITTKLGLNNDMLRCNLMNSVIPMPSQVIQNFEHLRINHGVSSALDYFYQLSIAGSYIKLQDISRNQHWLSSTPYGNLELTINLSKPEKDPRDIALGLLQPPKQYPKCLLCSENEGFAGDYLRPSRFTHRLIPLTLNAETWYFQFSPYMYYNRHSIVLSNTHRDMQINHNTFIALFDFVDLVPDYIIGSNTDIPIVGGSILSHDHFQAGKHIFPMDKANVQYKINWKNHPSICSYILDWPLSVIRSQGNRDKLCNLAEEILANWVEYNDKSINLINYTDARHNAINPIVRKLDDNYYQLDLILRNNRQNEQHPDGIFHPHQHLHHIKKENIGLIEAMGLAILPGRLADELKQIAELLIHSSLNNHSQINLPPLLHMHQEWINELTQCNDIQFTAETIHQFLRNEVSKKFIQVLECSGVFKNTPDGQAAFISFIESMSGVAIQI